MFRTDLFPQNIDFCVNECAFANKKFPTFQLASPLLSSHFLDTQDANVKSLPRFKFFS